MIFIGIASHESQTHCLQQGRARLEIKTQNGKGHQCSWQIIRGPASATAANQSQFQETRGTGARTYKNKGGIGQQKQRHGKLTGGEGVYKHELTQTWCKYGTETRTIVNQEYNRDHKMEWWNIGRIHFQAGAISTKTQASRPYTESVRFWLATRGRQLWESLCGQAPYYKVWMCG